MRAASEEWRVGAAEETEVEAGKGRGMSGGSALSMWTSAGIGRKVEMK